MAWRSPAIAALALIGCLAAPAGSSPIHAAAAAIGPVRPDAGSLLLSMQQSGTGPAEVTDSTLRGLQEAEELALQPPPPLPMGLGEPLQPLQR